MTLRLLFNALLAFALAAPAAAQRVFTPGSAPTVIPSLGPGFSPSVTAPAIMPGLTPGFAAPALVPSLTPSLQAPIPVLAPSAIPSAAVPAFSPQAALAPALTPVVPAASRPEKVVHDFKDIKRLLDGGGESAGAEIFDGAAAKPVVPLGALEVKVLRAETADEAARYIQNTPNTHAFIAGVRSNWDKIGRLDIRVYSDASGNTFRAVDLTGRPGLVDLLPDSDVQAHEKALIKKIQLHTDDLQIVLREEGKTPDLIVAGVVTEMKSQDPKGDLAVQLEHANLQLLAHSKRHGLGSGAIAVDLTGRDSVPVDNTLATINAFAAANAVGFHRVEVYAGADRKVFTVGQSRAFALENATKAAAPRSASRFFVPNALHEAPVPDKDIVLREVFEPAERLKRAGVKATITAYGSARILPPDVARAQLGKAEKAYQRRPKDAQVRAALHEARQAVENSKWYAVAREFGGLVAVNGAGEIGLVTGGGPGIMEAANRGALEKGGPSIGYNIILDKEQGLNKFVTPGLEFEFQHFSTRKMALRAGSMGLVYFPGGFGTMDELFEVLTLMQTRKMKRVPIVLVGEKAYWEKILDFSEFERMGLISHGDRSLFRFADTARGIWDAVAGSPVLTRR
ncbi:MAG: TIGR00730 family Rossman fold protein [Elusimicrobia bacterium]|nr:TIGR00730 family Rossman fold protein [Elusimicrobiota bacterium]